jgi:hypothetical protein
VVPVTAIRGYPLERELDISDTVADAVIGPDADTRRHRN